MGRSTLFPGSSSVFLAGVAGPGFDLRRDTRPCSCSLDRSGFLLADKLSPSRLALWFRTPERLARAISASARHLNSGCSSAGKQVQASGNRFVACIFLRCSSRAMRAPGLINGSLQNLDSQEASKHVSCLRSRFCPPFAEPKEVFVTVPAEVSRVT